MPKDDTAQSFAILSGPEFFNNVQDNKRAYPLWEEN